MNVTYNLLSMRFAFCIRNRLYLPQRYCRAVYDNISHTFDCPFSLFRTQLALQQKDTSLAGHKMDSSSCNERAVIQNKTNTLQGIILKGVCFLKG